MQPEKRFDPFRVLTKFERRQHLDGFLDWLRERDGAADARARSLDRREPIMRAFEASPIRWRGPIDREGFQRCIAGHRGERLDSRTEWILAAARANEGERYGVEIELRRYLQRGFFPGVPSQEIMVKVMLQEAYHCRILQALWRTSGLDFQPRDPSWPQRAMMAAIGFLPGWLRWAPVMAGELVGTSVFKVLIANLRLFSAQPEVEQHFRNLMRAIWIDEVLHVAYLRALLPPAGLALVRLLLHPIAFAVLSDVPQLRNLGCSRESMVSDACAGIEIPSEVGWLAPDLPSDNERFDAPESVAA
jgi:hypothetical protein